MSLYDFIFKRISLFFLLLHVSLFTRLRYGKVGTAAILGGCFVLESLVDYFLVFRITLQPLGLLALLAEIVIVQAGAWTVSEYRDMRAIFTGVSAAVYVLPGDFLCQLVPESMAYSLPLALLIQISVHSLLLLGMMKISRKDWLSELQFKDTNWFLLSIIPIMCYLIMYSLCEPNTAAMTPREGNTLSVFLLLVLTGTSNLVMMILLSWKTRSMEKDRDAAMLKVCVEGMQKNIKVLQEKNEELLRVRHDRKHYSQMVLSLMDEGKYPEAREAVSRLVQSTSAIRPLLFCENAAANAVISTYAQRAEEARVPFDCKADIPTLEHIDEYELATVLANLLANALRAASAVPETEERTVQVNIRPVKGMLLLQIKNTYQGEVRISPVSGLPESSRGEGHGLGMLSVKAFAQKYGGSYSYSAESGLFVVQIMVKM
jgi:two-component system sensor histidine kinase AgrC